MTKLLEDQAGNVTVYNNAELAVLKGGPGGASGFNGAPVGGSLSATVDLSSAELYALNTTPKLIVGAVAGKLIVPVSTPIVITGVTTTPSNNPKFALRSGTTQWTFTNSGLLAAAAGSSFVTYLAAASVSGAAADIGQPLTLNTDIALTGGSVTKATAIVQYILF